MSSLGSVLCADCQLVFLFSAFKKKKTFKKTTLPVENCEFSAQRANSAWTLNTSTPLPSQTKHLEEVQISLHSSWKETWLFAKDLCHLTPI